MPKKGKLIVFDAIDGAGKTTQVKLLTQRLRRHKKKIHCTDFPQYGRSFFGTMVGQYLHGKFGTTEKTNPYLISLLYALDRFEARDSMLKYLNKGTIIISDRYSPANKIHQTTKLKTQAQRQKFLRWLDQMVFDVLKIPKPDLVLFLDVAPSITRKLMIARGKRDMHETNYRHQQQAYKMCQYLSRTYAHWKRIQCMHRDELLTPAAIHEQVWQEVKKVIK